MTFSSVLKVKYKNNCLGLPAHLHRSNAPVLLKMACTVLIFNQDFVVLMTTLLVHVFMHMHASIRQVGCCVSEMYVVINVSVHLTSALPGAGGGGATVHMTELKHGASGLMHNGSASLHSSSPHPPLST